jgi:hypothetical protein
LQSGRIDLFRSRRRLESTKNGDVSAHAPTIRGDGDNPTSY